MKTFVRIAVLAVILVEPTVVGATTPRIEKTNESRASPSILERGDHRHLSESSEILQTLMESATLDLAASIPYVGWLASNLLGYFYDQEDNAYLLLWDAMKEYVEEQFFVATVETIETNLNNLCYDLYEYSIQGSQGARKTEFEFAEETAEDLYGLLHLSRKSDPAAASVSGWDLTTDSNQLHENLELIEYGIMFATLHIGLLKERYYYCEDIMGADTCTDAQISVYYEELARFANLYTDYFTWVEDEWKTWRLDEHTSITSDIDYPNSGGLVGGIWCTKTVTLKDDLGELETETFTNDYVCSTGDGGVYAEAYARYKGGWIKPVYEAFEELIREAQSFNDYAGSSERKMGESCFSSTNCAGQWSCTAESTKDFNDMGVCGIEHPCADAEGTPEDPTRC